MKITPQCSTEPKATETGYKKITQKYVAQLVEMSTCIYT